jgi:hypothetical protein
VGYKCINNGSTGKCICLNTAQNGYKNSGSADKELPPISSLKGLKDHIPLIALL